MAKKNLEGFNNFAFLSTVTAVSCLVILNVAIKLVASPDKLSSGEITSAASGVITLMMIRVILHPPTTPST